MSHTAHAEALVHDLQQAIGAENTRFDEVSRVLYSTDASNYQIMPIGVTLPRNSDDVCAIHEIAAQHGVPVLPRGGGSSLAGQTVGTAVVMDFSKHMRRVTAINAEECRVRVEPGMTLGALNGQLASLGLMFGPDPASAERATVGGVVGNNASGAHSIVYGMTADHVARLQVVLPDGEKVWLDENHPILNQIRAKIAQIVAGNAAEIEARFPKTWRTCAGYALDKIDPNSVDLNWLLAGSEGTLATIVNAELTLVSRPQPKEKRLALVHFDTLRASLEATPRLLELGPTAIELMDKFLLDKTRANAEYAKYLTFIEGDPAAVQVVEFVGESDAHLDKQHDDLRALLTRMGHTGAVTYATTPVQQNAVWTVRKAGLGLLMSERTEAKPIAFIEDASVPVEHLADYIQDVEDIIYREGTTYAIYAHASAGCLHVRPLVNLKTLKGREQYRIIGEEVTRTLLKYQGSITGEHGKGIARGRHQRILFGDQLSEAFREVKHAFDPNNRMNPGKMVDAPEMDDPTVLRYTPEYEVIPLKTRFDWSADNGYGGAIEMCNGAGVCRKEGSGTMCPSYQATREEAHSTRGRANALRAAISGKLSGDLSNDGLFDTLDLCLSCKACKSECPSSVDVAMLKADYLNMYHERHGVPFKSRVFGNIHHLNRLAGLFPGLSNFMLNNSLGQAMMNVVGLPTERPLPQYARYRFNPAAAPKAHNPAATVLVDTFTEYNHPEVGRALLKIASALGVELTIRRMPARSAGRPAISKGLLNDAARMANHNVRALDSADGPFLFLEPSELSAFIDEYERLVDPKLVDKAREIAAVCMTAEQWFAEQLALADDLDWSAEPRTILLHGHCHQKALWGTSDTMRFLQSIPNATVREIDSGCCGMAGSFGYEHPEVSLAVAQDRLLPAIEAVAEGTLIAAAGTSCRSQLHDYGHSAQHPLEILADALS